MNQPVDAVIPAPEPPAPPPSPPGDLAAALPEDAPEPAPPRACENCGTPLLGEHCYQCGQPTRGMVRHFSTILGDLIDTVFNFDSRTVRSIGPLLFRPGRLTHEYFEGHRVRFVSPVRLFFFFCVAAFLALQFSVDTDSSFNFDGDGTDISEATTVGDVEKLRDDALKDLEEAKVEAADAPGAASGLEIGMAAVRDEATRRIAWIAARDLAIKEGRPEPEYDDDDSRQPFNFKFDGSPWDIHANPVTIGWLPEMANAQLNRMIARAQRNIEDIQHEPGLLFEAFLQTLPQTLFILLPVFALLLKAVYLFKRRLYMEHLIVALHSHAFLCAALLVIVGVSDLGDLFVDGGFWSGVCDWAIIAMAWWMPIYLLIMQKRVYRQGWIMTLLKYSVLGLCYMVLISCAVTLTLAFNLVAM